MFRYYVMMLLYYETAAVFVGNRALGSCQQFDIKVREILQLRMRSQKLPGGPYGEIL
jgi:hypothetical protein